MKNVFDLRAVLGGAFLIKYQQYEMLASRNLQDFEIESFVVDHDKKKIYINLGELK